MEPKKGSMTIFVAIVLIVITALLIIPIFREQIITAFKAVTDPLLEKMGLKEPAGTPETCSSPIGFSCKFEAGILSPDSIKLQWSGVPGAIDYRMQWARKNLDYGGDEKVTSRTSENTNAVSFGVSSGDWYKLRARVESGSSCTGPSEWSSNVYCYAGFCEGTTTLSKQNIELGNGCKVTIKAQARDYTDYIAGRDSTGRWYGSSINEVDRIIKTTFDDAPSGECNGDLTFSISWNAVYNWISITNERVERGCGLFGWFCPNTIEYGYQATASGNCKFLRIKDYCTSNNACPLPQGINSNTLTLLQPDDTHAYSTFDYIVGECDSNSHCTYDANKPKCDTSTNMCVPS